MQYWYLNRTGNPCQEGSTCVDLVADYRCDCPPTHGGKNCSVELTGCKGVECQNEGACLPYYVATEHKFNCSCLPGFRGKLCETATTMSFQNNSYVTVDSPDNNNNSGGEGYELKLRFRTTLQDGLLAIGQGETYYQLRLQSGRLNLHSSLLNRWEGVFIGQDLNNGDWQAVCTTYLMYHAATCKYY
jgi:protein crumbs